MREYRWRDDGTIVVVEFDFGERVAVRRTVRTCAAGTAGLTGYVAGASRDYYESEVLSYAVFLHDRQRVFMIEPGDLESVQGPNVRPVMPLIGRSSDHALVPRRMRLPSVARGAYRCEDSEKMVARSGLRSDPAVRDAGYLSTVEL